MQVAASVRFVFVEGEVAKSLCSRDQVGHEVKIAGHRTLKLVPTILRGASKSNEGKGDSVILTLLHGWIVWKGKVCALDFFGSKQWVQVVDVKSHDQDNAVVPGSFEIVDRLSLIDKKEAEQKPHLYTHDIQFQPTLISPSESISPTLNEQSQVVHMLSREINIRLGNGQKKHEVVGRVKYGAGLLLTGPSGCGKTYLLQRLWRKYYVHHVESLIIKTPM